MNTNDDILPIGELPEEQRENYRLIKASLQTGDPPTARTHMGQLLEYYVQADREIPRVIEAAYGCHESFKVHININSTNNQ
jgi:hypothetical protein